MVILIIFICVDTRIRRYARLTIDRNVGTILHCCSCMCVILIALCNKNELYYLLSTEYRFIKNK